jgi:hypothetical protein
MKATNLVFQMSAIAAGFLVLVSATPAAQVGFRISIGPPELRVYEQPLCPGDGYLWTPGYWGWDNDYYWIPGEWILPPETGYLWTPGYWGWGDGGYLFNEGYWGLTVGFYGGIDYGFGYGGHGYFGGRWDRGRFFYNTGYNRINGNEIHNTYNERNSESGGSRVSYNGGRGGVNARATSQEDSARQERHSGPVAAQSQHAQTARNNPQASRQGEEQARAANAVHPRDLPAIQHPGAPNTGNAKLDNRYQKQQDQMVSKQNQDRQRLQQRQDTQDAQLTQHNAIAARGQASEQKHQAQTRQLQQNHMKQSQQMQSRQMPGGGGSHGGGGGGRGGAHK